MIGKQASRLPQALWLKFKGLDGNVMVNKLGQWIDPATSRCSQLIHAIDSGIRVGNSEIVSMDCSLVAPFGKHLLEFGISPLIPEPWFNLYNNIWNTNYPMWFSGDVRFRFKLKNKK